MEISDFIHSSWSIYTPVSVLLYISIKLSVLSDNFILHSFVGILCRSPYLMIYCWSSTTCYFHVNLWICFSYVLSVATPAFAFFICFCLIFFLCFLEATTSFCFFFLFLSHTFFAFSFFMLD